MRMRWSAQLPGGAVPAWRRVPLAALGCLTVVVVACYGGVLFGDRQFAFRDSAHFYYPLQWRVQQEWSAGRLPLWEPGANGGQPMLGSPMAAVLYPGKLVFALLPYAWGIRLYTVGHEVLAFWAMFALMRHWATGRAAATLAGLSYAFGGPVLSDYFNIIYLVGAAWLPLGILAADRWIRLGRRRGLVELALVLAMQVLGGDPEMAYLNMLCALGYGVGLSRSAAGARPRTSAVLLGVAAVALIWVWAGPSLARLVHAGGGRRGQSLLLSAWMLGLAAYAATRRPGHRARLAAMLLGLVAAGILALLLASAQVLPVLEHMAASERWAAAGPEDLFESSLLPYRVVEWIWPRVFGGFTAGPRYWMPILPPAGAHRPSPLSLYVGALPLILALGAAGFRDGPPWRSWMTAVVLLSFWGSLGEFAGPSGWSAGAATGDDSFYGLLTTALPVLRIFRFPYKLLTLTTLGLSALAAVGWDRFASGVGRRRSFAIAIGLLVTTFVGLASAATMRDRMAAAMAARAVGSAVFGPLDAPGAAGAVVRGLGHGAVALSASLAILIGSMGRRRAAATAMAMALVTADLAVAHAPLIIAIPQADFEREPEVLEAIRAAERAEPGPGPFRIQRLPSWVPTGWADSPSKERLRELVDWEIDTLQPAFGWLHGLDYVFVDESETASLDQRRLFRPAYRVLDPATSSTLGVEPGKPVLYHPRAAFDLWGARYFILPSSPGDWTDENRSYAAFIDRTDLIYPDPASMAGPDRAGDRRRWLRERDVQVRRNRSAFPRAWVVHDARLIRPLDGGHSAARDTLIARLQSADAPDRAGGASSPADLRRTAYVESDAPSTLAPYLPGEDPHPLDSSSPAAEIVSVREEAPTRTVIEASLRRPGLVVLANRFDPGWRLTIDGQPATIHRANLSMRAAAVEGGSHTLVFTYRPASARLGAGLSMVGLLILGGLAIRTRLAGS